MTTTTTTRRKWSVPEWHAKIGQPNPATGRPWSQRAIARELGLSNTAVSLAFQEYEREGAPPAPEHQPLLIWRISEKSKQTWTGKCLRANARVWRGEEISEEQAMTLANFRRTLEMMSPNTVVWYDRDANDGAGGWWYRPRGANEIDGDWADPNAHIVYGVMARHRDAR